MFDEPKSRWYDYRNKPINILEECFCDIFDKVLGTNFFIFGWIFRIMYFDNWADPDNAAYRGIQNTFMKTSNLSDFYERIEVTEDRIPKADWSKPKDIKLYNL